jgi:hypothetical protein
MENFSGAAVSQMMNLLILGKIGTKFRDELGPWGRTLFPRGSHSLLRSPLWVNTLNYLEEWRD